MQVRISTSIDDFYSISASVAVVGRVKRLVNIRNKVDKKSESLSADWLRDLLLRNDFSVNIDLLNNAILIATITFRQIAGRADWYIYIVPRRCVTSRASDFVGPR